MSIIVIIAIIIAVILMAFITGVEIAYSSADRLSFELKYKQGSGHNTFMRRLWDNPAHFMALTIVSKNFFLIVSVLLGAAFWDIVLGYFNFDQITINYIAPVRVVLEIVLSWFSIVILTRMIPIALVRPKSDSYLTGIRLWMIRIVSLFFGWISEIFVSISRFILNYIFDTKIDKKKDALLIIDTKSFVRESGFEYNHSQELQADLFNNALSLPKIKVRTCLVPRKEIEAIEVNSSVETLRQKFVSTKLSKLVVYKDNIDQIIGYIHQLDLFKQPKDLRDIIKEIPAIPESMSVSDLINKFSKERKSIAWVVDEFGGTAGIVTMEDLLEEIFGDIRDEHDVEELEEKKLSDGEYIFSGRLELDYLSEKYDLEFPENDSETLSGFIINQHETIPSLKDRIIINNFEFEVLSVSDTRIETVKLRILS
ncbi:hemolysin family protein [Gynurincola endophyticus]|uniref:hemolysin family protein n=1 Tax=Gynurincola endophyticus TaxID=2479004 RepID=UPI000F8E05E8|nr:hemolysin family protein [Gynurincola endophyticus]